MTFLQQGSAKHPPALCKLTSRKKVNSLISFVFVAEQNSIVCMDHIFLIRSSVDGHWGWFYFLAIVSGAAKTTFMESCSIVEYGTLWVHTLQWYVTGAYGSSSFRVSIVGELIYTPTSSKQEFLLFLQPLLSFVFMTISIMTGVRWNLKGSLIYIPLIVNTF